MIQFADLVYAGAFRLPKEFANGDNFSHGGAPIAFNPGRNSLFVTSRKGNLAEVSIPGLISSGDITKLQFASFVQAFYEPTEGAISQISGDKNVTGLLVMGERLYGSAAVYYDANNDQRVSHFARSTTLSAPGVDGMKQVWLDNRTGFVSGYMSTVPVEWQPKLGGPAVTGQCCIPIAWRTSWGPSAFAFNPADISTSAKVAASPLVYYSDAHPTLGPWQGNNLVYSASTDLMGVALIAGSRTALYIGRTGTGAFCYGEGLSDAQDPRIGQAVPGAPGETYCYDPTNAAKGQHGYPYHYQIWAYDMNDLAAVKAGTKNPWDVLPYGVWPFTLPYAAAPVRIGGIGYDASRQIIYISQLYADQDTYEYRPIIHALKVSGVAGAPLPPPSTAVLPPITLSSSYSPGSARLTALALSADKPAPQPAGTTIVLSATPTGGATPHQYKWFVHDGLKWNQMADWSTSNTFQWTPTAANSQQRVGVWVRSAGNLADAAEFTQSMDFAIGNPLTWTAPYEPAKAVTLAADKAAPQAAGSMITWTASASGGQAPYQYKFLVHNGLQWTTASEWSTSATFIWTPALVNSQYRVGVWVRSSRGTADLPEASSSADFAINGVSTISATSAPPPPSTTTSSSPARLTALSLVPSKPAPQPAGTTITFSATPTGGAAPHQYKWLVHDGLRWIEMAGWSTASTFNWTPAAANSQHRVGVWVRSAGSTADAAEFTQSMDFPITAVTSTAPAPTTAPTARLTAVAISPDKSAPQPAGTTVTFSASPTGGAAPQQYKWLVHDGLNWSAVTAWSTASTFTWTPTVQNSASRIGVWVRSAGNTIDAAEVTSSIDFPISAAVTVAPTPAPATTTTARLTEVTLGSDKPAPQPAGTTITLSAVPTGGTAHQYKWLIHNGLNWSAVSGWSFSNTFSWTPASANSSYRVGVWVRTNGSTADVAEFTKSMDFPIGR